MQSAELTAEQSVLALMGDVALHAPQLREDAFVAATAALDALEKLRELGIVPLASDYVAAVWREDGSLVFETYSDSSSSIGTMR